MACTCEGGNCNGRRQGPGGRAGLDYRIQGASFDSPHLMLGQNPGRSNAGILRDTAVPLVASLGWRDSSPSVLSQGNGVASGWGHERALGSEWGPREVVAGAVFGTFKSTVFQSGRMDEDTPSSGNGRGDDEPLSGDGEVEDPPEDPACTGLCECEAADVQVGVFPNGTKNIKAKIQALKSLAEQNCAAKCAKAADEKCQPEEECFCKFTSSSNPPAQTRVIPMSQYIGTRHLRIRGVVVIATATCSASGACNERPAWEASYSSGAGK